MRMQICCGYLAWNFCGTPNSESQGVSDSFASSSGTFPSAGLHSSSLDTRVEPRFMAAFYAMVGCNPGRPALFLKGN